MQLGRWLLLCEGSRRLRGLAMTLEHSKKRVTIEDFFGKKSGKVDRKRELSTKDGVEEPGNSKKVKVDSSVELEATTDSKTKFKESLSSVLIKLLELELTTIEDSWFEHLQQEFKKPYFVGLKQFIKKEKASYTVFPPEQDVYSWTRLTPFDQVKVVIIGQDPYHNHNQAHGLAFSVKPPTPAPPSLKNIYKELKQNYSDFVEDDRLGDLTPWAKQGVLLLNTALTVRAHNANSHSKHGWETFTKEVVQQLINDRESRRKSLVFLLWGNNAIKLVENLLGPSYKKYSNIKVFKSVHPSPLSASRGFFGNNHFKQINEWLHNERHELMIDWSVVPGSHLQEVSDKNAILQATTIGSLKKDVL